MAWADSKIFSASITDLVNKTTDMDCNADTFNAALFNNTITPSQTVASASTAYGAGVWASGGVSDTNWPAAGRPLSVTSNFSSNVYTFDSTDTAGAGNVTLAAVYGTLVYSDTAATPVADQGISYNYFGGTQDVTNGTFTIVWNGSGVWSLTL